MEIMENGKKTIVRGAVGFKKKCVNIKVGKMLIIIIIIIRQGLADLLRKNDFRWKYAILFEFCTMCQKYAIEIIIYYFLLELNFLNLQYSHLTQQNRQ